MKVKNAQIRITTKESSENGLEVQPNNVESKKSLWYLTITGRMHKKMEKLVKRLFRFFIKLSEFNPDGTALWGLPDDLPLSWEF